ncbi:STAS domain-containing protein [Planosporangium flavigriseum]|uniref:STAS domain-containing protein n=1 Tax=Planosporangium flavigriseum TaxID=373681 RepID=UPI00143C2191|nr:STAS domain-containing protein [Planosporangium flavigriseum]NJC66647.1 STAS domain-containing protein [Planosporangium flavigriseum]
MSDGTVVVDVRGELDLASTATLREDLSAEVSAMRPPGVVVDLGLVTFIDSIGLSALIGVQRDISSTGVAMRVVNPSPLVARMLHVAGVDEGLGCHAPRFRSADRHTPGS